LSVATTRWFCGGRKIFAEYEWRDAKLLSCRSQTGILALICLAIPEYPTSEECFAVSGKITAAHVQNAVRIPHDLANGLSTTRYLHIIRHRIKMPTSDDEDALLDSLENETENDPTLAHLRESRTQTLSVDLARAKQQRNEGYGTYSQITDEKKLMETTTSTRYCVVHFYKPDFNRCRIMDGHLEALAPVHLQTRFLRMDVEHAPFLVAKLGIKVLPCVIAFVDGISVDRVVGFEGLGYSEDTFKTEDLEKRLVECGVLEQMKGVEGVRGHRVWEGERWEARQDENGDDDDEWD